MNLKAIATAALLIVAALLPQSATATEIQRVTSPAGIEIWLVEDHTVPVISLAFGFEGGTAADPKGKEGVATLASGLFDEGAGELDSRAFQQRIAELGLDYGFTASADSFTGGLRTLTQNKEAAVDLLALALTRPRFDPEPVERMRRQCPQISLKVVDGFSNQLYDWLQAGRADVAVLTNPVNSRTVKVTPLISEPIVVYARAQPRGGKRFFTVADLVRTPVVSTEAIRIIADEQLQRHNGQERRQRVGDVRDEEDIVRVLADLLVTLGRHRDDPRVPGSTLHHVADDLVIERGPGGDGDQRTLGVKQGDGPVLELAGGITLRVDVADLLELQSPLEGDREPRAPPHEHEPA